MTLSFHKVNFSAQEVLDLMDEVEIEGDYSEDELEALKDFGEIFTENAEERSRR